MRVVRLSVGLPREVQWQGRTVLTSIFKTPVDRRLRVSALNFEGDRQSDLTVHGGVNKAVYGYPSEHYDYWRRELAEAELPLGAFGENVTTDGLLETNVRIGDRYRVGSAELIVTQPRLPCYKLGIRLGRPDFLKQFLHSGRPGFYFAVTREGEVGPGDSIELITRSAEPLTVANVINLYIGDGGDQELLRRAIESTVLPESWKKQFRKRLREPGD